MLFERFQRIWLRLLRVPPEPTVLPGETSPRIFRAAPRFYTWRLITWGISQLLGLGGVILIDFVFTDSPFFGRSINWGQLVTSVLLATWFIQMIITYILIRLDYEQRWYIVTDRSLRIREGVLRLTERTMTFANIQQLTVRQGPLQRILGISDLVVRSAGGGGGAQRGRYGYGEKGPTAHIATFSGVDNAEEIRTAIRNRMRYHRDAGLGDPDDGGGAKGDVTTTLELATPRSEVPRSEVPRSVTPRSETLGPARLLDLIRELGAEAGALRETLGGDSGS